MELRDQIWKLTEEVITDESIFVVDVKVSSKGKGKVSILLDGDNGINIDQCASVSRLLGNLIEEQELLENAYNLEVSSPGIDLPFKHIRQYKANIGRRIEVDVASEEQTNTVKGELKEVAEDSILVAKETKVKKKVEKEDVTIPFSQIKQAKPMVSFK